MIQNEVEARHLSKVNIAALCTNTSPSAENSFWYQKYFFLKEF